jgi:Cu-processing system permease protein
MTASVATATAMRERAELRLIGVVARKVLREAVRDRWFWLYCLGFAVLAGTLATVAVPDDGVVGPGGFGRTAASLVALVQLVIPLMALTLGARSLAAESESGSLRFLLSQPVSRTEVLLGTWLGLAVSLFTAVAAGFGSAGIVSSLQSSPVDTAILLRIAGLSFLLSLAMLSLGMVISVSTRRTSTAMGTGLFVWLVLVFLGDLGIMGTTIATGLPVQTLFLSVMVNPVESFRLASIVSLDASLDALGPAGSYAVDTYGNAIGGIAAGVIGLWTLAALLVSWAIFRRRSDL